MIAQQQKVPVEQTYRGGWHTCDEINFLRGLLGLKVLGEAGAGGTAGWAGGGANPEAFFRYAALVMDGRRTYDDTVEVERVLRAIDQLLLVAHARLAVAS